jgi:hypothetical protein
VKRLALVAAGAALALAGAAGPASAASGRRVVVAILPASSGLPGALAAMRASGISTLGLMTTSLGNYDAEQTLLDITQGARVPGVDYASPIVPAVALRPAGQVAGWRAIERRAASAGADLEPGALASALPGGAGFVDYRAAPAGDWLLAADRAGRLASVSLGSRRSVVARAERMLTERRLVVVDVASTRQLGQLRSARGSAELLVVIEALPRSASGPLLLALGASGLSDPAGTLTSSATRTAGLVAASDLAPTILQWLDVPVPHAMIGQAIHAGPPESVGALVGFADRLAAVGPRRSTVLICFALAWLALLLVACSLGRGARGALRLGGLAALWAPVSVLAASVARPGVVAEVVIVVGGAFALARASERFVAWPRAAAVPAVVTLVLYGAALLAGSGLVETSLLGSDPIAGSRFFGAGNELAAVLAVELLVALAALGPARRVTTTLASGALLTLMLAWGRGGANVGAVFTDGGAVAAAALVLAPGQLSARRIALAGVGLAAGLGLLTVLDLATGGGAHWTAQILHAQSFGALVSVLYRRAFAAWATLTALPVALAVLAGLGAAALVFRKRALLLPDRSWQACFAGLLAGGLLGSLAADSGPRVLLIMLAGAACALAYLQGGPVADRAPRTVLMRRLAALSTLRFGSGVPQPDPPNLMRR